jgi:hypothetical protein
MLEKCALAKGLRRAFTELHGSYTPEEIETDGQGNVVDAHIIEDNKTKAARQLGEWSAPKGLFYYDISTIPAASIIDAKRYLNSYSANEILPNIWKCEERLTRLDKYQTKEPPAPAPQQEVLPIEVQESKAAKEAQDNA